MDKYQNLERDKIELRVKQENFETDLSEIRGASNYWHVQTKPPPRWCLSCCV
tara:strand:- start:2282 stop:2437 length:156 start_codon:yes stop_codon:yes gene_type:complete